MEKFCILFNPKAGNGRGAEDAKRLRERLGGDAVTEIDVTTLTDYKGFFEAHGDESIVLCGGDGTINRFANDTAGMEISVPLYYYATGTGNDFLRDIEKPEGELIPLEPYLKDLPVVEIDGKESRFLNGVGYGIDGYCCEVGDRMRAEEPGKPINYTGIAIKGLLFAYKPTNATVTVDGKEYRFKKVWIAPTMHGRYYGGGMNAAPAQDRLSPEGTLSVVLFHGSGKLHTLMVFPKIFKGEHTKSKITTVLTGRSVTVEFDSPRAVQIDGETVLGVKKYSARSGKPVKTEAKTEPQLAAQA